MNYQQSKGLRLSEPMEAQLARVGTVERLDRSHTIRFLLQLGLASYRVDPDAGSLLDGLVGRLDHVAEIMEACAFPDTSKESQGGAP